MSTDPREGRGPERSDGPADSRADDPVSSSPDAGASAPHPDTPPEHSPAIARPRHGSGLLARILTAVYALVVTPIATGLLAYGGTTLVNYAMSRGYLGASLGELLAGPAGVRVIVGVGLGVLLLATIVATGIFSSAGLLATGAVGLVSVLIAAVPALALQIYTLLPPMIPFELLDGISYGLTLVLHPLIGGLGLALVIARRHPAPHLVASLLGLLLVPAGLLISALMLFHGHASGVRVAVMTFSTEIHVLNVALVVLGALLLFATMAATRWSPYALVIPAIVLLLVSVGVFLFTIELIPPMVWTSPSGQAAMSFLFVGGGFAAAVVMLVHTGVLATVRTLSRRRLRTAAGVPGWARS